jgi:hypothetical protein
MQSYYQIIEDIEKNLHNGPLFKVVKVSGGKSQFFSLDEGL